LSGAAREDLGFNLYCDGELGPYYYGRIHAVMVSSIHSPEIENAYSPNAEDAGAPKEGLTYTT
jgi:hypothetical protein